jgi:hypothetical protein
MEPALNDIGAGLLATGRMMSGCGLMVLPYLLPGGRPVRLRDLA